MIVANFNRKIDNTDNFETNNSKIALNVKKFHACLIFHNKYTNINLLVVLGENINFGIYPIMVIKEAKTNFALLKTLRNIKNKIDLIIYKIIFLANKI